ncbi:condensation domain-containing protein [Streptomyces sp. NPDC050704]|uniref:phthiocerol/phthiodiolone dimycocerosyl transferase family protein n=1 Tax=Streptomyces sp. NPDC050704 TaxID=3157219 RepID=UPI00341CEF95
MTTVPSDSSATAVERSLGVAEHFMWLMNQHRPNHSAVAVEIRGHIEVDQWRTALRGLQCRHPLLAARIHDRTGTPLLSLGHSEPIPFRVADPGEGDWQSVLATEMRTGINVAGAPPIRVTLLHSSERCALVIVAHHAVVDGLSETYLVRDLVALVSGERLAGEPSSRPIDSFLQEEIATAAAELPTDQDFPVSERPGVYRDTQPDSAPAVFCATLDEERTRALRARARAEGTTVHGAVAAAVLHAAAELNHDWSAVPLRVHTPISLRGQMPVSAEEVGNILAPATTEQPGKWGDFWAAARAFTDGLAPYRENTALFGSLALWTGILQGNPSPTDMAAMLAAAAPHEVLLTNLGVLPIPASYGALTIEALWGPSVFFGFEGEQTVGLSTLDGTLRLLHTSFTPVTGLLELAREHLLSAVEEQTRA